MIRLALALVLTASCSCSAIRVKQTHGCYTRCGLFAERAPDGWTCSDIQDVEDAVVVNTLRFSTDVAAMMGARICDLSGWTLSVVNLPDWYHNRAGSILGLTECEDKQLFINNVPWSNSSLAHEYVHAFQKCKPDGEDKADPAHANWRENGLYDVINNVRVMKP